MKNENNPERKGNYKTIFFILLAIVALANYGKILWPEIWHLMRTSNVSFWETILNLKAHIIALTIFLVVTISIMVYVYLFKKK